MSNLCTVITREITTVDSVSYRRTNFPSQDMSALQASVVWLEYIGYCLWNADGPASIFETSNNYKVLLLRNHYYFYVTFVIHRQSDCTSIVTYFQEPNSKVWSFVGSNLESSH